MAIHVVNVVNADGVVKTLKSPEWQARMRETLMRSISEQTRKLLFGSLKGAGGGKVNTGPPDPVGGAVIEHMVPKRDPAFVPLLYLFSRKDDAWQFSQALQPKEKKMTDEAQHPPISRRPEEYLAAKMLAAFHDDDYVEALKFAKLLADAADELRDQLEGAEIRLRNALAQLANANENVETVQDLIIKVRADLKAMTESRETVMQEALAYKSEVSMANQRREGVEKKWNEYLRRSQASRKGKKKRARARA